MTNVEAQNTAAPEVIMIKTKRDEVYVNYPMEGVLVHWITNNFATNPATAVEVRTSIVSAMKMLKEPPTRRNVESYCEEIATTVNAIFANNGITSSVAAKISFFKI
ncbi:MAG: hypothetical protein LBC42_01435 [Puniceicoccales bacterium]|nr:hypothetical protein [Puniceicoccales bacterium]